MREEIKYMHGELKTCKKCIKTNFHGEDISYDMYWNETTVLKIKCIIFFLTKILKDFRVIADEWQNS